MGRTSTRNTIYRREGQIARVARVGQTAGAINRPVTWARTFMSATSSTSVSAAELASARYWFGPAMTGLGFVLVGASMLTAGYRAMTAGRKPIALLSSSHTFAHWLFEHRSFSTPTHRPIALRQAEEREDAIGDYNRLSSAQFEQIWQEAHTQSLERFNSAFNSIPRNQLEIKIREFAPTADTTRHSVGELRNMLKVFTCSTFEHDPAVAGLGYLVALPTSVPKIEQRVATALYRHHPFSG